MENSIGNDIVALKATDPTRTVKPAFYRKFLSQSELDLYTPNQSLLTLDHFIWMAWSAKEAAYKYLQRLHPTLTFSPIKIQLTSIECHKDNYYFKSKFDNVALKAESVILKDEVIHTIVHLNVGQRIEYDLKAIESANPAQQSLEVRALLLMNLKKQFPLATINVQENEHGIPNLLIDGQSTPVSFSHHDKWIGYAINF